MDGGRGGDLRGLLVRSMGVVENEDDLSSPVSLGGRAHLQVPLS